MDESLTSSETKHQVKSRLLLDVVVTQGATVFKLLAGEDETLLVWWDAFLVLNFSLHVLNSVAGLNIKGDCFACEGLNEDLHATSEAKHQVKSWLLLDVVVAQSATVFKLLASEDKTLLIWRNALLVLNLCLHVLNGVAGLNIKGDCLACEGLNEDLHATSEAKHQVKSWLLLDVVVAQSAAVFKLLAGEDKTLLVWRDALLVLDLCLHVLNGITGFNIEGNGFSGKSLYENLHVSVLKFLIIVNSRAGLLKGAQPTSLLKTNIQINQYLESFIGVLGFWV